MPMCAGKMIRLKGRKVFLVKEYNIYHYLNREQLLLCITLIKCMYCSNIMSLSRINKD